jgi:NADPH-dependent 2,4-dienoyl-CoA reductase/sulfur reductase-like enzyme
MLPNVLPNMDSDMSAQVAEVLADRGVKVMTAVPLDEITCNSTGFACSVRAGEKDLAADIVLLALGVRPRAEVAQKAGISLGAQGAISVGERQETSIKGIYAAGDCCQTKDIVSGRETYMPLATVAEKQGKVAGENAARADSRFAGILGTGISSAFGLAFASTGLTAEAAKRLGINAASQSFVGHSHAAYYPNPKPLKVKVVFDPKTGKLLGAQAVGEEGVLARMNAFIAAIHAGLTVKDLTQLDLPYAPPFGSSWDPIHVVAMMAERKLRR